MTAAACSRTGVSHPESAPGACQVAYSAVFGTGGKQGSAFSFNFIFHLTSRAPSDSVATLAMRSPAMSRRKYKGLTSAAGADDVVSCFRAPAGSGLARTGCCTGGRVGNHDIGNTTPSTPSHESAVATASVGTVGTVQFQPMLWRQQISRVSV